MDIINDQKKCMASLAVFKQLFNSGHNIFSIIAEFVKQEIISNGLTDFTEQKMHDLLMEDNVTGGRFFCHKQLIILQALFALSINII